MKTRKNVFCMILTLVMLFACSACGSTTEKDKTMGEGKQVENTEKTTDTIVHSAKDLERIVKTTTGEQQHFILKEDIVLGMGAISFNGTDIAIDGGDERVTVTMSSTGGFNFKGVTYPEKVKASSSVTIKNVDFVNDKTEGTDRDDCYVYTYADNVVYENCTFKGGVIVFGDAKFVNCLFSETDDLRYCIFVDNEQGRREAGMNVEITGCNFNGNDTAYGLVKVADDSNVGATLKVSNCQFQNIANKPAVYVNGQTQVTTEGTNTYTNCTAGAILAKDDNCTINGEAMIAGTSYEQ